MKKCKKENEDSIWVAGSFTQTLDAEDPKEKMKTFHMRHDEDMRFNCKKCNKKISAHNNDWHDGMCDSCFNEEHFPDD